MFSVWTIFDIWDKKGLIKFIIIDRKKWVNISSLCTAMKVIITIIIQISDDSNVVAVAVKPQPCPVLPGCPATGSPWSEAGAINCHCWSPPSSSPPWLQSFPSCSGGSTMKEVSPGPQTLPSSSPGTRSSWLSPSSPWGSAPSSTEWPPASPG